MKPSTENTMLLGYMDTRGFHTHVVNLTNFHLIHVNDSVNIHIEFDKETTDKFLALNVKNFMITVSDDPYATWTGDWNHLGCSRFHFASSKGTAIEASRGGLMFVCDYGTFTQDIVLAERFTSYADQLAGKAVEDKMEPTIESYVFIETIDNPILYLKSTTEGNMHASVTNLYKRPHVEDTLYVAKGLTKEELMKLHYEGAFQVTEDSKVVMK